LYVHEQGPCSSACNRATDNDSSISRLHCHLQGFYARPEKGADGALNLMSWEAGIPGKANVSSAGVLKKLRIVIADYLSSLATDQMGRRSVQVEAHISRRISQQATKMWVYRALSFKQRFLPLNLSVSSHR
jgi:hypothetical protein